MPFISLMISVVCFAQTSPFASMTGGPSPSALTYEGRYTAGHPPGPGVTDHKVNVTLPTVRGSVDSVAPQLSFGQTHLDRPLALHSGRAVPRELTRTEVGAQYLHQRTRGRTWGVRGAVGYAGDKPFTANEDLSYSLAATYGYPGNKGYWVFMVMVANNGVLPNYLPIPGVLYVYRTPHVSAVLGIPVLNLTWTPTSAWSLSLSAFGPLVRGEAAYGDPRATRVFVDYALGQQLYIPDRREQNRDRLRLQDQRAALGLRRTFDGRLTTELQGGYAFERSVAITRGFGRRVDSVRLPADWFGRLQASYAF